MLFDIVPINWNFKIELLPRIHNKLEMYVFRKNKSDCIYS